VGKYSKRKGYRGEYQLVKKLRGFGINAIRVPVSGAVPGFKHDIYLNADRQYAGEVKVRKAGFKQLYDWIHDVDFLFVKADREEYLVVMRLDLFAKLFKEVDR